MKRLVLIATAALALAACGGENDQESYFGSDKAKKAPPLAENPPMSASDLDAIVEAERQKQNQPAPTNPVIQEGNTNGN